MFCGDYAWVICSTLIFTPQLIFSVSSFVQRHNAYHAAKGGLKQATEDQVFWPSI